MAASKEPEVDRVRSTGAYPMDAEPVQRYGDTGLDYTQSTMAYPMYDTVAEARAAAPAVRFETPGPQTFGDPAALERQRNALADAQELGAAVVDEALADDTDDAGEPDTGDVAGDVADDVADGEPDTGDVATGGDDGDVETKVIDPPAKPRQAVRRTQAQRK